MLWNNPLHSTTLGSADFSTNSKSMTEKDPDATLKVFSAEIDEFMVGTKRNSGGGGVKEKQRLGLGEGETAVAVG
jgi:hypothetical protein